MSTQEKRSPYKKDYSLEDNELDTIENEEVVNKETPSETSEELSWKKRYGDLRTYMNDLQEKAKKDREELEAKIQALSKQDTKIPVNEEEFKEWVNTYPKVAKMMEAMVLKQAKELEGNIEELRKSNSQKDLELRKREAKMNLAKAHPDFFEKIAGTAQFLEWVDEKAVSGSDWIKEVLYDPNGTDWRKASDAIKLYKAEVLTESNKPQKTKANPKSAAEYVSSGGSSAPSSRGKGEYLFSESQVNQMSERDFEKYEDEIDEAIRNGKFLYDISGAAR